MGNESFEEASSSQNEHIQRPAIKKAKIVAKIKDKSESISPRPTEDKSGLQRLVEQLPWDELKDIIPLGTNIDINNDYDNVAENSVGACQELSRPRKIRLTDPHSMEDYKALIKQYSYKEYDDDEYDIDDEDNNDDDDDEESDEEDSDDEQYERWHAQQVEESRVQNHINSWTETYDEALGYSEGAFMQYIPSVNTEVQDQGIMMAIESHGLQPVNSGDQEMPQQTFISQPSPFAFVSDPITRIFEIPGSLARGSLQSYEDGRSRYLRKKISSRISEYEGSSGPSEGGLGKGEPAAQFELHCSSNFLNEAIRVAIKRKGLSVSEDYGLELQET